MNKNKKSHICGAKSRRNNYKPCKKAPMKNGRCYFHGGPSTGAKSLEGKRRAARANLRHGRYTKEAEVERANMREMMRWRHDLLEMQSNNIEPELCHLKI